MPDHSAPSPETVYAKTALGQQEIQQRTLRLPPLLRRVLLLADGRRSAAQLAPLAGGAELAPLLAELEQRGCLERLAAPAPAGPTGPAATPPAAAVATPDPLAHLPPASTRSEAEVAAARHYMINSVSRLMDPVLAAPFVNKVGACKSAAELRAHYPEWAQAVGAGWGGARRLAELLPGLLAVL